MKDGELRRLLQSVAPPDELGAERRSWAVVRAAWEEREPVPARRRALRPLVALAAAIAVVAAAFSPPGEAVRGFIRDAMRVEGVKDARPALVSLPARGPVLVVSGRAAWVVRSDGSKRRLGAYEDASWSPGGLYVVVTRGRRLAAVTPTGVPRWGLSRTQPVHHPRWSPSGFRIAYGSGASLRVVAGDGTGDTLLARAAARGAWAWRPGDRHLLAYATQRGVIRVVDTDTRKVLWRYGGLDFVPRRLAWSADGRRLLAVHPRVLAVFTGAGRFLSSVAPPTGTASGAAFAPRGHEFAVVGRQAAGRSQVVLLRAERRALQLGPKRTLFTGAGRFADVAWAPNGKWLLVGWPSADQWLFLRVPGVRKVVAVSGIAREFDPGGRGRARFPRVAGWCCPAGG